MKVERGIKCQETFTLEAETAEDQALLDALDMDRAAFVVGMARKASAEVPRAYVNSCAVVDVRRTRLSDLPVKPLSQRLSCLGDLHGLRFCQQHLDSHVCSNPTDPQPHVALASCLVQLQVVAQTLSLVIGQAEAVLKEMQGTHGESSSDGSMVARGGQA